MTKEEKEILLKDLCARLPYGLKVKCEKYPFPVTVLYAGDIDEVKFRETGGIECIYTIKPYLFPPSSMTEEQLKLFDGVFLPNGHVVASDFGIDYLNSIYVDYRGLIPKGLAIDATGLNIYKKMED